MPSSYSPTAQRFAQITLPSGGDPRTAASVDLPLSQIFDTLAHVSSERILSPSALGSNQDNYNPSNWSDATYIRLASSGAVIVNGANASVLQTHKILHNIGNNSIALGHLESGQTAGNQFSCFGAVDHLLPPGEAAIIIVDPVSAVWRVIGLSRGAAQAWSGAHTWTGALSVTPSGVTSVVQPQLNHSTNEWDYVSPRSRLKQVPLNFILDTASVGDVVWNTHGASGGASLGDGKASMHIPLDTGCTITGIFASVTPGGTAINLSARRETLNILSGALTITPMGTPATTSGAGLQLMSLGSMSVAVNNAIERYLVIIEATAALQICGGIWVTYSDPGPRGY